MIILRQKNYGFLGIEDKYQTYNKNTKATMSPGVKRLMSMNPLWRITKGKPSKQPEQDPTQKQY